MTITQPTRRDFLTESSRLAIATWISLPALAALASCAREDVAAGGRWLQFTPAESRAMEAFAAQIIPSDGATPGAREAGAARFVDRALGTAFFAGSVPLIRAGLADLDSRARANGAVRAFAGLTPGQQVAIMRQVEHGDFFRTARTLVIIGTFADPSYGGNRGQVGWTMIGIDHGPAYSAPFGYYDANPSAGSAAGAA